MQSWICTLICRPGVAPKMDSTTGGAVGSTYPAAAIAMALALSTPAIAAVSSPPDRDAVARLDTMYEAADAMDGRADLKAYRKAWEAVYALARTIYPADHPRLAMIEGQIGVVSYLEGDVQGALARSRLVVERLRRAGADYAEALTSELNGEVVYLMTLGRHGEARDIAAEVLARRRAQYGEAPHRQVAAAYGNLAQAEFEFGNYDIAIENSRRAIAEAKRTTPPSPNLPLYLANLAIYLGLSGRTEAALEAAHAAQRDFETLLPPDHPTVAQNLNTLARLQLQLGRPAEAETTARRATDLAVAAFGETQQTANYLATLAQTLVEQRKPEEGRAIAERAVRILERDLGADADRTLMARETLAAAMASGGDPAGALAMRARIAETRRSKFPPHHRDRILGGDRMATEALMLGALPQALAAQGEAQALRAATYPVDDIGRLVGEARLGAIEARGGQAPSGLRRARAAAEMLDRRLMQSRAAGATRTGQDREARSGFGWALDAALSAGDADAAFAFAQRAIENAAGRAAADAAARDAVTDPAATVALRERQDVAADLQRALDRQLRVAGRGEDTREIDAERAALTTRLTAIDAQLAVLAPALVAAEREAPVSLAEVRAVLEPEEALLLAAPAQTGTALIAVTRKGVTLARVDLGREPVETLIRRLRAGIAPGASGFDFAASAALYDALFPAPIAKAVAGRRRLLIATGGSLSSVPFAALAPAMEAPSFARANWLIRDHAIVQLPGVAVAARRRAFVQARQVARFVAVGAPALAPADPESGIVPFRSANLARQVAELPSLPATVPELRALGLALAAPDQTILTGAGATEAAVRGTRLAGVVAFATHGLMPGELDGLEEPALVVTPGGGDDGLLTASEIMRLRIDADWVVLSACNTAGGGGADDAGFAGLARAFLHAGSRNLLVSHWAVRDDAAAFLSVETVKRYRAGADPAEALREAMLVMLHKAPVKGGDQPVNWAPFVFVGR